MTDADLRDALQETRGAVVAEIVETLLTIDPEIARYIDLHYGRPQ